MTSWEQFERLTMIALCEPVPVVDVRVAVLRSIRTRLETTRLETAAAVDPFVLACGGVAVAAAVVALALVLPGWDTVGETFVTCLNPLTLVLQ